MTLAQACNGGGFTSGVTTLEQALASPIGEIHVQAIFPQVNTTVPAGAEYPTGFTRGSVVVRVNHPMTHAMTTPIPSLRETAVNTNAVSRSLAVASMLLATAPALAEQYGPLEVVGFLKNEYSLCDNCSAGLVNPLGLRSARRAVAAGADGEPGRRLGKHGPQPVPRAVDARPVARVRQRL